MECELFLSPQRTLALFRSRHRLHRMRRELVNPLSLYLHILHRPTSHLGVALVGLSLLGCQSSNVRKIVRGNDLSQQAVTSRSLPNEQPSVLSESSSSHVTLAASSLPTIAPASFKEDLQREEAPKADATSPNAMLASTRIAPSSVDPVSAAVEGGRPQSAPFLNEPAQSIDLVTALLMTSGQSPQVAFAKARIDEARAQWDRAESLKLPSIRAGVNYNKHEGRIQDVAGHVIETSRGSFYSGLGANAVGAGSPTIPGIVSQFHVADAIFQPKIAQRTFCARQAGAEVAMQDALYATSAAYVELLRAQQELALTLEAMEQAEALCQTTSQFAKVGQGLTSDDDRARTELSLRKSEAIRAQESVRVASARLAERIRWDGLIRLEAVEEVSIPIHFVAEQEASSLISQALNQRPEIRESKHLIAEAVARLHREKNAPLMPSLLLASSYGGLGGGLGSHYNNYGDRLDADAVAYWEIRQLGAGESSARKEAKARIQQARHREIEQMDRVAREVIEAHIQVESREQQIALAQSAVRFAEDSYRRNWERIQNGKGLPIEVLQAMQALNQAKREYVRSVADFHVAQFALCRAIGWPALATVPTKDENTTTP